MGTENPQEKTSSSDQIDPIANSIAKVYFDQESKSIKEITMVKENHTDVPMVLIGEEIPLFPIQLKSGEEYIPDLCESDFWQTGEETLDTPEIFTIDLKQYENVLFRVVARNGFDKSLLLFAKDNLYPWEYARFIIEQVAVIQHLSKFNQKTRPGDEIKYKGLVFYWPSYYPGKDKFDSDFLPTTEELYPVYLFNRLAYILTHRERYDLKDQRFTIDELHDLQGFINDNYAFGTGDMFNKIKDQYNIDSDGIDHMMRYDIKWQELLQLEYTKSRLLNDLDSLPKWEK
jgi:hypothetical protein